MNTCRTCTNALNRPFRRYDERGHVLYGCIDPDHTGHLVTPSASASWHAKGQKLAKQLNKGRTPLEQVAA